MTDREERKASRFRKARIVTIIMLANFLLPLCMLYNVDFSLAQTTISGEDLKFVPVSVEKINAPTSIQTSTTASSGIVSGISSWLSNLWPIAELWPSETPVPVQTTTSDTGTSTTTVVPLDGNGAYGNFRVDYAPAGLISASSQLISSGDDYIKYMTSAVFEETLNVYTVTPPESVQTKHTDGKVNWFANRRYSIDNLNGYWDQTPGHPISFLGQGGVGTTYWPYPWPTATDVNRYKGSPETLSIEYDYYALNGIPGYIDSFKNLNINVGLNPATNVVIINEDDTTQKIRFGIDNWTVTSINADQLTQEPVALGEYDVSFVGMENNKLSLDLKDNVDPQSITAQFTQEAEIQNTLRSYSDAVSSAEGFGADPVMSVAQNSQFVTPTFNKVLYSSAYDGESKPANITIGCWVRPEIKVWTQHAQVQVIGFDSNGALTTPLEIRTRNDYWPSINGGARITNSPSILKRSIDRICQVQANNYVAQFKIRVGVKFPSTATFEGISTESVLGLPSWQQGDMVIDMGIRGETGEAVNLLHQYDIGSFMQDTSTAATIWSSIIMNFVWIILIVIVAVIAFMIVKKFTGKR